MFAHKSFTLIGMLVLLILTDPQFASAQTTEAENPVRIAVISDLNSAYGSTSYDASVHETIDYIIEEVKPDLVLCGGDMVAGQKTELSDGRVRAMWQAFDENIADRLRKASIPFAFTIGNHDGSGHPPHERDREIAELYWKKEDHRPDLNWIDRQGFPFYYSFNLQDVNITVWDASTATVPDSNLIWLKNNIDSSSASDANLRVLVGHLPLYGVSPDRDTEGNVLRHPRKLHSLIQDLGINLYVSGHHHAFYPAHKEGLQLLHAGAIGSGPRQLLNHKKAAIKTFTILDIFPKSNQMSYKTFNVENWNRISHSSLPDSIESRNGVIFLSGEKIQLKP